MSRAQAPHPHDLLLLERGAFEPFSHQPPGEVKSRSLPGLADVFTFPYPLVTRDAKHQMESSPVPYTSGKMCVRMHLRAHVFSGRGVDGCESRDSSKAGRAPLP